MSAPGLEELKALAIARFGEPSSTTATEWRWRKKGSLSLTLTGAKAGLWHDFEAGTGGRLTVDTEAPTTATGSDRTDLPRQRWKIRAAGKTWNRSRGLRGNPAERYLVGTRGIPCRSDGWPVQIAFDPLDTALVAAVRDEAGAVVSVLSIFLTPDGQKITEAERVRRKLPNVKRTLGPKGLGLLVIGPAEGGPGDTGRLFFAEGLETALAIWAATGERVRVTLGPIADVRTMPSGPVLIAMEDHAPDAPITLRMDEAITRWTQAGADVSLVWPWPERRHDRGDLADVILAGGPEAVAARIEAARRISVSGDIGSTPEEADNRGGQEPPPEPPPGWDNQHPPRGKPPSQPGDPLPNGAYLRPEDTTLPAFHPPITESREDAEYRLKDSINSWFDVMERVLPARKELSRRRDAAIEAAVEAAIAEAGAPLMVTPIDKAAITRRVMAELAAETGFPGKRIPRASLQLETGSQGTGKTHLALVNTSKIKADLIGHKYAPTLAQAEEDAAKYRAIATEGSMPGFVVRGRSAADPLVPGATMCRRPAVTDRAAKLGISPALTICKGCKFFWTCGTKRQERTIAALGDRAIFFLSREYAFLVGCPAPDPDFIIGDEQMTLPAVSFASIEPAMMVGEELLPVDGRDLADVLIARKTLERLRPLLKQPQPLAAIRDACIDKDALRTLRGLLDIDAEPLIHGQMSDAEIDKKLDLIDHPDRRHMLSIVRAVLREIEMPRATFQAVKYNKHRDLIMCSHLRHVNGINSAAVLLLDGTGDIELNEKLTRREINHNVVRMERDAEVIGTIGKRYSRQSITGKNAKGEDLSPDLVDAAKRLRDEIGIIASHFEAPLLTATMRAEQALVDGGHLPPDVVTSHPGLTRGRNEWEDRLTAISVGAEAGSIEDLELIAGAFYATDPVPIVSMAAPPVPEDNWPKWPWPYRATRLRRFDDPDKLQVVHVDVHPDPRVQRVIEQIREAGVTQDIDRVRPIYNRRTLVLLNELVLDVRYTRVSRHKELVEGGTRIDRVLRRTDGILPMTPEILVAMFPDEMGSVSTARRAIRAWRKWGQGSNDRLIGGVTPLRPYLFRRAGQPGSASVVLIAPHHPDPKAAAEAVLGSVALFMAAPAAPSPVQPETPPADAPPTPETVRMSGLRPASHTQWVPPTFGQPGIGAAPVSSMVHGPPDG